MTRKEKKRYSIDIDRKNSEEIIVKAINQTEANRMGWKKFSKRKPKKKDHQMYCQELYY
ncbi:MAG: hypothetical protein V1854_01840 [Methanobacteriota archaeon]